MALKKSIKPSSQIQAKHDEFLLLKNRFVKNVLLLVQGATTPARQRPVLHPVVAASSKRMERREPRRMKLGELQQWGPDRRRTQQPCWGARTAPGCVWRLNLGAAPGGAPVIRESEGRCGQRLGGRPTQGADVWPAELDGE
jgi:hypothetical protein